MAIGGVLGGCVILARWQNACLAHCISVNRDQPTRWNQVAKDAISE